MTASRRGQGKPILVLLLLQEQVTVMAKAVSGSMVRKLLIISLRIRKVFPSMDIFSLLILAVLQGLTEFLPVSSSAHLVLMQHFTSFGAEPGPALELLLHGGTLLSILFFYRRRILELLTGLGRRERPSWLYAGSLLLSCIPAAGVYFLAGDQLDEMFSKPLPSALLLLVTGAMLVSTRWLSRLKVSTSLNLPRVLAIALAQAVALLPGISRSGSTIVTARWLGISAPEAAEFSFLMAIPLLAGGILLKAKDIMSLAGSSAESLWLLVACLTATAVGILALKTLSWCQVLGKFWCFGVYCLALGLTAVVFLIC